MARAHSLRGMVLDGLGRRQEAVAAYRQAVELDPYLLEARTHLHMLEALAFGQARRAPAEGKGFWIRAGAYVIDMVAFNALYLFTTAIVVSVYGLVQVLAGLDLPFYGEAAWGLDYVVPGVLLVLYFAVFEWLFGATLGKLLLRLRVIRAGGARCTLGAALIRSALRYFDGLFFGLLAYITMKPPLQQRMGDKPAKTVVVDAKDPAIREPRDGGWFVVALLLYLVSNVAGALVLVGAWSAGP